MRARPHRPRVAAVVLAAGRGQRLGPAEPPKQYVRLGGRPLLTHAVAVYQALREVDAIALVVPAGDEPLARALAAPYPKVRWVVAGGPTRCESARAGVEVLEPCDVVVIQNAASPFTPGPLIVRCVQAGAREGAAAGATRSAYTSVEASGGALGVIHDRAVTWSLRDPQAFDRERLGAVYERAHAEGLLASAIDEVHLFARYNHPVALVEGPEENFKITVRADLERARAVLRGRHAEAGALLRGAARK
jgi:2-C-methyl-D-erythritol 4-phosphate cytidylyltransferase